MPETVSVRADISNVFSTQTVIDMVEQGDLGGGAPNPNYQRPVRFQLPRTIRFSFDMKF